ncbi:MAG: PKD domain-containing protein [Bacteroidota bacterium]
MKNACLFVLCLFIMGQNSYAQHELCGTVKPSYFKPGKFQNPKIFKKLKKEIKERQSGTRSSDELCITHQPILVHIIRRTDGTGGISLSTIENELAGTNESYEDACMAFYIAEVSYIDNDTYYDFNNSDESTLHSTYSVDNIINIYFANTVTSGTTSICGYAKYPGGIDIIMMKNSCASNGSTLTHELGHFFNLPHTHSGGNELVDGSNCATAGDDFCDTPADPNISGKVNVSCDYTGTDTDANGDPYTPDTYNIMSYSRKSCRIFYSVEQLAESQYIFENVRNYFTSDVFSNNFSADQTETCNNSLTVQFSEECVGEVSYQWDFQNDGTIDDTGPNPSFTYTEAGNYDVRLVVSDGSQEISRVMTGYIKIGAEAMPSFTDIENFPIGSAGGSFIEGWKSEQSSTNDFKWRVDENGTASNNTGPNTDHTLGTSEGNYFYTEATGYDQGDVAEIVSPCIDIPATSLFPELSFYYHMFGDGMGTLHIDVNVGSGWINSIASIVGEQQQNQSDPWLEFVVPLNAYVGNVIQIRFRGIRGNNFKSDMSIDDIRIHENIPCEYVYTNANEGPGSLREATNCGGSNPILFAADVETITLDSPIEISGNLSIIATSTSPVTIITNEATPLFDIKSGVELELGNLNLDTPDQQPPFTFEDSSATLRFSNQVNLIQN